MTFKINSREGLWIPIFRAKMTFCISFTLQHAKIYSFTGTDRPLVHQEDVSQEFLDNRCMKVGRFSALPTDRHYYCIHNIGKHAMKLFLWSLYPGDHCVAINILFFVTCDSFKQVWFRYYYPIGYRTLLRLFCSSEYSVWKTTK